MIEDISTITLETSFQSSLKDGIKTLHPMEPLKSRLGPFGSQMLLEDIILIFPRKVLGHCYSVVDLIKNGDFL